MTYVQLLLLELGGEVFGGLACHCAEVIGDGDDEFGADRNAAANGSISSALRQSEGDLGLGFGALYDLRRPILTLRHLVIRVVHWLLQLKFFGHSDS